MITSNVFWPECFVILRYILLLNCTCCAVRYFAKICTKPLFRLLWVLHVSFIHSWFVVLAPLHSVHSNLTLHIKNKSQSTCERCKTHKTILGFAWVTDTILHFGFHLVGSFRFKPLNIKMCQDLFTNWYFYVEKYCLKTFSVIVMF